jgi:hypothetical protein
VTWLWAFGNLMPFGIATPILFGVAGAQARRRAWKIAAVIYGVIAYSGLLLAIIGDRDSTPATLGGLLILVAWIGGAVHGFLIRPAYARALAGGPSALDRARDVVHKREEAQRLVAREPQVARQMGVGRPDVPGAIDMGVVDINHAGADAIAALPGVDDALAREIVRAREACDGFKTLAEMGGVVDLEADTVEDLRPFVVFLPR